jgi:WhiB family transcriptional regulator, redox-sensing transcriptional regulator
VKTPSAEPRGRTVRWREHAACRASDPELFFPVGTTGPVLDEIRSAKAVCQDCPVREPCLQFALETNQDTGIWGGTTEEERRRLRRAWVAGRSRRVSVSG